MIYGMDNSCSILFLIENGKKLRDYIGIVDNAEETSSDTSMHDRAITVLHERWMCLEMQRHTHITLWNMVLI